MIICHRRTVAGDKESASWRIDIPGFVFHFNVKYSRWTFGINLFCIQLCSGHGDASTQLVYLCIGGVLYINPRFIGTRLCRRIFESVGRAVGAGLDVGPVLIDDEIVLKCPGAAGCRCGPGNCAAHTCGSLIRCDTGDGRTCRLRDCDASTQLVYLRIGCVLHVNSGLVCSGLHGDVTEGVCGVIDSCGDFGSVFIDDEIILKCSRATCCCRCPSNGFAHASCCFACRYTSNGERRCCQCPSLQQPYAKDEAQDKGQRSFSRGFHWIIPF